MEAKRLQFIDITKGVAIILVVVAHLIQTNTTEGTSNVVFQIINSFHMPLFFFASGFIAFKVCKLNSWRDYGPFFVNKLRSLILPLVVWTLFINKLFLSASWNVPTLNDLKNCIINPGLWFLMTLFQISLIFGVLHLVSSKIKKWFLDAAMALLVLGLLVLTHQMSLGLYFIFYTIGVFVSKYRLIDQIWNHQITVLFATFIFFVLAGHWEIDGSFIDDILKLTVAPCAFVIIYALSKRGEGSIVGNKLSFIGKNSLAIYIIHWNFLQFFKDVKYDLVGFNQFWLFILSGTVALIIIYAVIAIAKVIEINKYLSFLLFGRKLK